MAAHEAKDEGLKSPPSQSTSELVFHAKVNNYVGSVFIIHGHPIRIPVPADSNIKVSS